MQVDYNSWTYLVELPPLFMAVSKCSHRIIECLLQHGACPNRQDIWSANTCLHLAAAKRPKPCYTCIRLLVKHHADSLITNFKLKSAHSLLVQSAPASWSIYSIYASVVREVFDPISCVPVTYSRTNSIKSDPNTDDLHVSNASSISNHAHVSFPIRNFNFFSHF